MCQLKDKRVHHWIKVAMMENIAGKYWPLLKVCNCLDKTTREKVFEKLAYEKDFRKLMKAFMRHVCTQEVSVPRMSLRDRKKYGLAAKKVALKKTSRKARRKYIRQLGGAFPFFIPILASIIGEVLSSVV